MLYLALFQEKSRGQQCSVCLVRGWPTRGSLLGSMPFIRGYGSGNKLSDNCWKVNKVFSRGQSIAHVNSSTRAFARAIARLKRKGLGR